MALIYGNAISTIIASSQYAGRTFISSSVDNLSITAWINPTAINVQQDIFQNGDNGGNGYELRITAGGKLRIDVAFVAGLSSTANLTAGAWQHVAAIRDGGVWQLYINGVANGSTITSTPNPVGSWATVGASRNGGGTASNLYGGLIDDVRFYERAITTGELTTLVSRASDPTISDISSTSLRAWWKMDESSGNPADSSGNALTLTAVNTPTFVTGIVATGVTSGAANGLMMGV